MSKIHTKGSAFAGCGKTTYIKEEIGNIKSGSILLVAFNKKLQLENKHLELTGHNNKVIKVKTFHSLAYGAVSNEYGKFSAFGYLNYGSISKRVDILNVSQLKKVFTDWCNSSYTLEEFINVISNDSYYESRSISVNNNIPQELVNLDIYLKKSKQFTHEYYLKLFQLMKPKLKYDYIFVDEVQDLSDVMLDIINNQQTTSNITVVGDTEQTCYGWRGASAGVNGLNIPWSKEVILDKTYRCPQEIVDVALPYLGFTTGTMDKISFNTNNTSEGKVILSDINLKEHNFEDLNILSKKEEDYCVVGRTNAGLIAAANYLSESEDASNAKLTLNIDFTEIENHYLYHKGIKGTDNLINSAINNQWSLKGYYKKNALEDKSSILSATHHIKDIELLKAAVNNKNAKYCISLNTVFVAKGLEWSGVALLDDFTHPCNSRSILVEEFRYLYVAITRAKNTLIIPKDYLLTLDELCDLEFSYFDDISGESNIERNMRMHKFKIDNKDKG